MIARVVDIDKDKKKILINLLNNLDKDKKVCLCTEVYGGSYIKIFYSPYTSTNVLSTYDDLKKAKCILVKNIGKIINKAFSLLDYDMNEIKSIEFKNGCALITFIREEKENGADIGKQKERLFRKSYIQIHEQE